MAATFIAIISQEAHISISLYFVSTCYFFSHHITENRLQSSHSREQQLHSNIFHSIDGHPCRQPLQPTCQLGWRGTAARRLGGAVAQVYQLRGGAGAAAAQGQTY